MAIPESEFVLKKVINSKPHFAIIGLATQRSNANQIVENYTGSGFTSQGVIEDIPENGYNEWKEAALRAATFVLAHTESTWTIDINRIGGRICLDTNPTTVAYATIFAICEKTGVVLNNTIKKKLDDMLYESWDHGDFALPNFENFSFEHTKKEQHSVPSQIKLPWYSFLVRYFNGK